MKILHVQRRVFSLLLAVFLFINFISVIGCRNRDEETKIGVVTETADKSWFEDCLMIGNSRLVAMIGYCGLKVGCDYTKNGYTVNAALRSPTEDTYNGSVTVAYALENGPRYDKCCIMFGVNECGMETKDDFRRDMNELLNILLSVNPDMDLYVLTEYSVREDWESTGPTPEKIQAFNDVLKELAGEKGAHVIDLYTPFADENGYLLTQASDDGLHMNVTYTEKMLEQVLQGIITD